MKPLGETDVEEQLSIAYLHAVCAHARMSKTDSSRPVDNNGVDAQVVGWAPFGDGAGYLTEVQLNVQLKATKRVPRETETHYSYHLDSIAQYDDLRSDKLIVPRFLVVLFLPDNFDDWLDHSNNQLLLRRCAYWVSLRGAAASLNRAGQTVYIPKDQPFSPASLRSLALRLSHNDVPLYQQPLP